MSISQVAYKPKTVPSRYLAISNVRCAILMNNEKFRLNACGETRKGVESALHSWIIALKAAVAELYSLTKRNSTNFIRHCIQKIYTYKPFPFHYILHSMYDILAEYCKVNF